MRAYSSVQKSSGGGVPACPGMVAATRRIPASAGSAITSAYERALHIPPGRSRTVRWAFGGPDWTSSHAWSTPRTLLAARRRRGWDSSPGEFHHSLLLCAMSRRSCASASETDHARDRSSCKSIERFESCPVRSILSVSNLTTKRRQIGMSGYSDRSGEGNRTRNETAPSGYRSSASSPALPWHVIHEAGNGQLPALRGLLLLRVLRVRPQGRHWLLFLVRVESRRELRCDACSPPPGRERRVSRLTPPHPGISSGGSCRSTSAAATAERCRCAGGVPARGWHTGRVGAVLFPSK